MHILPALGLNALYHSCELSSSLLMPHAHYICELCPPSYVDQLKRRVPSYRLMGNLKQIPHCRGSHGSTVRRYTHDNSRMDHKHPELPLPEAIYLWGLKLNQFTPRHYHYPPPPPPPPPPPHHHHHHHHHHHIHTSYTTTITTTIATTTRL